MSLALVTAFAAIAIAHLRMKLALLVGGFARPGEFRAFIAVASDVSLLTTALAIATTTATSNPNQNACQAAYGNGITGSSS